MGLTVRKDSLYIEFRIVDDGHTLRLAGPHDGGRVKRWKANTLRRDLAKQQEAVLKTELMKGVIPSERRAKVPTFREWGARYLALPEVQGLRSFEKHVRTVDRLAAFFGDRRLCDLTAAGVEAYRATRQRADGTPLALSTVNWDHAILKAMLNKAIRRDLLAVNAASKVRVPIPRNERDRILSGEEWDRLSREAAAHLKPILLVAYRLGMRYGEIVRLTWDRVDRERGLMTLRGIDTKTNQPRQVPMTADVLAALKALFTVRRLGEDRVFLREGQPIRSIKTAFQQAVKRAGLANFRFHDLRHCAATALRRAGVDTTTAMAIIGHRSPQMWRRYNSIAAADKINTLITREEKAVEVDSANIAKS